MNLPKSVSYNTTGAAGVAATPGVGISYRTQSPAKAAVEAVTDGGGSERYGYDALGRVIDKTRTIEGIEGRSYQTQYEYNTANQMVLIGYPSGKRVRMRHDERGRVSAIERVDISNNVQERYVSEVQYRVEGLVSSQKLGSGVVEEYGYSADRLQLTSQRVSKDGNALMNVTYGYTASAGQMGTGTSGGNTGQLIGISGTINGQRKDQSFSYDTLGRLKTATGFAVWERRFEYDRWGNRTGMWDRRDGGTQLQNVAIQDAGAAKTNRIASVNGVNYSHDASGNVTSDGVHTFQYDAESRMVSVDAGVTARYTYDSNNWRVKKEAGGVVTHYVWEGGQVIAEYEFGGGNTSGAGVRYYEPDRLSTRVITNGSGAVVGTLDQLPFGEEAGAAGESEKHKFTSYERDSETGTDYAVNRQYQNALGRFMRPDPYGGSMSITDPQSFNRYTYVGNDPINSIDPLGLQQDPPLVIDVEDPPPAPQQPIESNDTLVVNTNEPGFFFFFPGFIDRPLLAFVRIDIVIGGLVDADGGGGDFFTPPVPLVPEPPAAPPPPPPNDCQRFVNMVQDIANLAANPQEFFDTVARTFTAANNSSIYEMLRTSTGNLPAGRPRFTDTGFKQQFQDKSNQARHFVGGFIAGARLGITASRLIMNAREYLPGGTDADIALNAVSTTLGSVYADDSIEQIRASLASSIKKNICN